MKLKICAREGCDRLVHPPKRKYCSPQCRYDEQKDRLLTRYHNDPEVRERMKAYAKNRYHSDPAARERMREQTKKWKAENKPRMKVHDRRAYLKRRDSPEYKARMAQAYQERRQDPAWVEEQNKRALEYYYQHRDDPEFLDAKRAKGREYARKRRATDEAYRERESIRIKERNQRVGSKTRRLIPQLLARDGMFCQWCGEALGLDRSEWHVDHIVPQAKGGPSTANNLQVLHARCNMSKGARG